MGTKCLAIRFLAGGVWIGRGVLGVRKVRGEGGKRAKINPPMRVIDCR